MTVRPIASAPRVGLQPAVPLLLNLMAPPAAWAVHLTLNYALASRVCYPGAEPLATILPVGHVLWWVLPLIDVAALAICSATIWISYRLRQWPESPTYAARTRFLAQCGIILGAGFFIATLFDGAAIFMVPLCGT
jgi:hypothetical protein